MDMTGRGTIDVSSLVKQRKPGFSLAASFYNSREVFDLDLELIFGRHWIFVAVEPEVPEPGDYVTVQVGSASVIIVRDDAMQVRAFHNVCRHRGSRILTEARGFVGNLVCPYHQWTYDLTGALLHTESMPEGFDRSCFSLKPVHVRSLSGLIFICLSENPPQDFDDVAATFLPYVSAHRLQDCKVAKQIDIVENGNWKLTIENNRECYHCGGHPELLRSLFHFFGYGANDVSDTQRAYYERYERSLTEHKQRWDGNGLPWQAIEKLHGRPTGFRTERLALEDGAESYTIDTKVACRRLMGELTETRLGSLHLHTQPNSWHHFLSDHAVSFSVLPLAHDRTLVRTTWMVHKDAVEGVHYDADNLTKVWRATNEQDARFVTLAQTGSTSPAYEPGPYSPTEYMVDAFCTWYVERLQAGLKN
jgi:glycine betaine catabolism A